MAYESHHRKQEKQMIHITMKDNRNVSYSGTLILQGANIKNNSFTGFDDEEDEYDQVGASYYVIAVVLVYGMSIVLLIASHIKRRHAKIVEDKQIDKYLQDFQIVRDKHDRDTYRNLKRTIMKKINYERSKKDMYKNLHASMMPLIAVAIPGGETEVPTIATYDSDTNISRIETASFDSFDHNDRTMHTSRRQREYMALTRQASKMSIAKSYSNSSSHVRTYSLRVPSIQVCNKLEQAPPKINYNNFRRLSLRTPSKEHISANAEEYIINYQRHKDAMATNLMEKANELANCDGIINLSNPSRKKEQTGPPNKDPQNIFIVWNSEKNNCDTQLMNSVDDPKSDITNEAPKPLLECAARKNRKIWARNHNYHAVISPDSGCDTPSNDLNIEGLNEPIETNRFLKHCNTFPPLVDSKFEHGDKQQFLFNCENGRLRHVSEQGSFIDKNMISEFEENCLKLDFNRIIPVSPSRPERGHFDPTISPTEDDIMYKAETNFNVISDKCVQVTSL